MNATALSPNAVRPPSSVTLTDGIKGLAAIRETGCAAVILKRHPMSTLETWLNSLETEQLPSARVILEPCRIQEALCQICDSCGTPTGPERRALMQDIATLAKRFADLMDVRYLRLRLDVVTTNACRKFHIDAVTARLICIYRGQTTQLGEAEPGCDPDRYISVPAGAPVVLRGTKWSGDAPTRLRHRSPPIAGTGESRLLLVLDPIYDLEEKV